MVALLRLPRRPQPAAAPDQERPRRPGVARGAALPADHGVAGAAGGRPGAAHPAAAAAAADPAAGQGDGLVPAPAAGDAVPPLGDLPALQGRPAPPAAVDGPAVRARLGWPPVEWFAGRVDVFHATNFVAPPARRAGLVVTIHDLTDLRYPEMVTAASARYRTLVPAGLARGAIVCTPTAAVAAEVLDTYHLPADRVMVTPLGVGRGWLEAEPPDAAWLAARGLPPRYLLFVGSREPRK